MLCADITEKPSYTDKLDIVGIAIHQNKLIWGKGYPSLPILQFFNIVQRGGGGNKLRFIVQKELQNSQ